jgi:hypothetical protein
VEARLLARAAGSTVPQLRAAARRAVLRADAAAATRRPAAAIRDRSVRMFPGEDGMAALSATLPLPVAAGLPGRAALLRRGLPDPRREWTTPGGDRITTHPPAYGTDDHPPPEPEPPRTTLRELVLGRPHPPGTTGPRPRAVLTVPRGEG